jgi:hypothetical protein
MTRSLQFNIAPDWGEIDRIRTEVIGFLRDSAEADEVVAAISMVACELTENAIKYGDYGPSDTVHITVSADATAITVEVQNPTSQKDTTQLARLDRTIQWIRGHQDPFEAYLARLKEVAVQSPESGESGLGLVRIAYEGESSLDFYLGEGSTVSISAVYQR